MSNIEWFDIFNDDGAYIGQATRQDTHHYGYWHRTFHCWLYEKRNGIPYLIFQQRQAGKDTNPLCYDITVAGHLIAGETIADAVREIHEEIGVNAVFDQLQPITVIREDAKGEANNQPYWDREISSVFAYENTLPIQSWTLQPEEVLAVYAAPLTDLKALFNNKITSLHVTGYQLTEQHQLVTNAADITAEQFVPRDVSYYLEVIEYITKLTTTS